MKNSYFGFAGITLATATALNMAGVANASVAGLQGLHAKNYLLAQDGSAATGVGTGLNNAYYSVMDVYIKFNSANGTGSAVKIFGFLVNAIGVRTCGGLTKHAHNAFACTACAVG